MSREVFLCAGEASGDLHGSELLAALRRAEPAIRAFGVGGPLMEKEGFETIVPISSFGQAGLVEVLAHLPRLLGLFNRVATEVEQRRPAVAVLIDFPDFNLRLAKRLHRAGIRVVYHVSPQLWAWRKGRIRTIRENVDRMTVLFPFEEKFYQKAGVPVRWVGHPIVDALAPYRSGGAPLAEGTTPIVALMPGSRRGEVRSLLPGMLLTAAELRRMFPGIRFRLVESPTLPRGEYAGVEAADIERIAPEGRWERLRECHGALVASGTATLELALLGVPMVVGYRLHPASWALARLLVDVPHVGLVNLVAGERIVPERLQSEFRPDLLAADLAPALRPGAGREAILARLASAAERLGPPAAGDRAAHEILEVAG